ncbi:hypothetical protein [Rugamonas rivuli]|uniref:Uncharacterized protein n=1 Tax=Rugamonas rivuli TaxID=2743358 RepID=A0A843SBU0_9BURK|nr:hypothetical protein [Rugamonas rivuli]MQA21689.1 hypothetical protein [Rugamonas rivuli]
MPKNHNGEIKPCAAPNNTAKIVAHADLLIPIFLSKIAKAPSIKVSKRGASNPTPKKFRIVRVCAGAFKLELWKNKEELTIAVAYSRRDGMSVKGIAEKVVENKLDLPLLSNRFETIL